LGAYAFRTDHFRDRTGIVRLRYELLIERRAQKQLARIAQPDLERIVTAVRGLAENPRPTGVKKLAGREAWRICIGDYRVIYELRDQTLVVLVISIRQRRDAYRGGGAPANGKMGNWQSFDRGHTIGQVGSENGLIIRDEVFQDQSRITLEKDSTVAPFAITCGVFGWMVHTRYFGDQTQANAEFATMKEELARIVGLLAETEDITVELEEFIELFP
jgi:mRNA interferase RelE/StbE